MNLISCKKCGVVLNKETLIFCGEVFDAYGELQQDLIWNGVEYVSYSVCPVCGEKIPEIEV